MHVAIMSFPLLQMRSMAVDTHAASQPEPEAEEVEGSARSMCYSMPSVSSSSLHALILPTSGVVSASTASYYPLLCSFYTYSARVQRSIEGHEFIFEYARTSTVLRLYSCIVHLYGTYCIRVMTLEESRTLEESPARAVQ